MNINNNLDLLNKFLSNKNYSIKQRFQIIEIAKVSYGIDDLIENIRWEYDYKNIK